METLYHYCPNSRFESIINNREIWLSSLTLSNDSMEGKLVARTLRRIAKSEGLDELVVQGLQDLMQPYEAKFGALGFCLSSDPDVLSQWRGYADDASGVSIGFSSEYLKQLGDPDLHHGRVIFSLGPVMYTDEDHELVVKPTYNKAKEPIDRGALNPVPSKLLAIIKGPLDEETRKARQSFADAEEELSSHLLSLLPKLFYMKAQAFQEEKEWRLVSLYFLGKPEDCKFRASGDRIIPYRSCELRTDEVQPIKEVWLGPKNRTPIYVVEDFLKAKGFGEVPVRKSTATYR